jgi:outer membrane immunogenic protein
MALARQTKRFQPHQTNFKWRQCAAGHSVRHSIAAKGQLMKSILIASVALAALTFVGEAQGADVKTAQSRTAAALTPSWTGFYAGLGVGLRATQSDVTTLSLVQAGVVRDFSITPQSQRFDGTTFLASPYIGFSWQIAPRWIAGIEGSFGLAKQTNAVPGLIFSPAVGSTNNAADSLAVKTTWNASLRADLGTC